MMHLTLKRLEAPGSLEVRWSGRWRHPCGDRGGVGRVGISEFGFRIPLVIFEIIVLGILSCASSTLLLYSSMSIGHLANKRKILCSFGAFIGISMITSFATSVFNTSLISYNYSFEFMEF